MSNLAIDFTETEHNPLAEKAMLVSLNVRQWSGRKLDREITNEVNKQHNASTDAGRYNKLLVDKSAFSEITKCVSALRSFHNYNTMPWSDNGSRLLPADNYLTYTTELRRLVSNFDNAADQFATAYEQYVNESRIRLNGMFKANDYPPVDDIRNRFSVASHVLPVPIADDFRVNVSQFERQRIQRDIMQRVEQAQAQAMQDLWQRLYDVVLHAANKLSDKDAVFRNSLIDNIRELVDILPRLNIANDKNLEQMRARIESSLAADDAQCLRESSELRESIADTAKNILLDMAVYTGQ